MQVPPPLRRLIHRAHSPMLQPPPPLFPPAAVPRSVSPVRCGGSGHNVKIPETSVLGLAAREITPLPADAKALDEPAANKLKRAAGPGLILEVEGDALRATQQWTTAGAEQSEELSRRLVALGEELGHPLEVRIEGDRVTGVFWTPAVNGLTENDFILAAKVNNADFKDLLKKRKRRVFA